ncbi:hypothetical protein D9619_008906 [Psilocybe cf. subviscida]|uniref:Mid2 domain-containing protein n=1 Tax=Psilocybe cf. subviscida TaxID=2480587 RepID=A0A8H5BAG7_9AGAR|nr:hypothetical protein D9619_008906 [Psilocybe cf. subviscida]
MKWRTSDPTLEISFGDGCIYGQSVLPKIYFGSSSLYLHLQMNNNQRGRSVVHLCPASSPSLIQMIRIMVFSGATNFLLASIFVLQCVAQSNRQFQWSFRDKSLSNLPTCSPLSIVVESFDTLTDLTTGVPPYYMISYPIGGMPITSLLGSDIDNLTWTPTHPLDSEVILNVVDSTGGSGGVSANPRRVIVSANVSGSLSQCESWGVTVSGGFPPYIVMLAETNSPVVTNSTPLAVGGIIFPKRVNLGGSLVVAIADAQGQWASGTPVVHLEDRICKPALPFTPSTTSSQAVSSIPSPSATLSITSSGIIPSATSSPITSQGAPATIQVEIAFQSPRTDIVATPTSSSVTSRPMSSNPMTPSTLSNLPSSSVAQRQIKAIALGLSIPLAVILTIACGVLGFCLHQRRRRRSISQQVVYQQPSPFITTSGIIEGYEGIDNGSFEQRAFNLRRDAKMSLRTGGADLLITSSAIRDLGERSSSQATPSGQPAARALQPLSTSSFISQDPVAGHSSLRNEVEGPPDYRSHISEPLSPG